MPRNSDGQCTKCGSFCCTLCEKWLDDDFKIGTFEPTKEDSTDKPKRKTSIMEW